jgi:probable phosphoglycerate mutase
MSKTLPIAYLARHGETTWTKSHRHTGRTDLPLTPQGEAEARRLGQRLKGMPFAAVLTSPLRRGNYGAYEGCTSADIHAERPDWQLFRDGAPAAESPDEIGSRADRVIRRVRAIDGNTLLLSSGHFLRMFAARWLGREPGAGSTCFSARRPSARSGTRTVVPIR